MRNFLPFAALALFACYSPNLSGVRFSCTGDGLPDDCPSGYSCVQSVCVLPGEPPGGTSDGGMTMTDGGAPADGGASLGKALGCTSMSGYDIAKDPVGTPAFACPGTFQGNSSTNAYSLCATGYRICPDANTLDLNKCTAPGIQGFFIANKRGEHSSSTVACGGQGNLDDDHWFGCGNPSGIVALTPPGPCFGFSSARDCVNMTGSEFNCRDDNDRSIDEVSSTNPVHGVLCCKQ